MIEILTDIADSIKSGSQTISAAKNAVQTVRELTKSKTASPAEIESKLLDLTEIMVDARTMHADLIDKITELKAVIAEQDDWKKKREAYSLVDVARGVPVLEYVHRDENDQTVPHYACPVCSEKKMIIPLRKNGWVLTCPNCDADFFFGAEDTSQALTDYDPFAH
ncbi:MAG: hypothetical protein AAFR17_12435 [Pseudomonadota bacterium]